MQGTSSTVVWVYKYKWETPTTNVESLGTKAAEAVRTIRARLTLRGFKDQDRGDVDRYAGTSSRVAQKLIVSEAVRQKRVLLTTDISKAFLQGVTYKELSELTGKPMREVNFYLPMSNVHLLRQVPGFESFDPQKEVLHCDKPGTGLVDALRAFTMKLSLVTRDKCGLIPSKVDPELCMRHDNGAHTCIMTKHVDDLKIAGRHDIVKYIIKQLQDVFGELKVIQGDFTNCGVRHVQCPKTFEVALDQIAFASNLRLIAHTQVSSGKNDDLCDAPASIVYVIAWSHCLFGSYQT